MHSLGLGPVDVAPHGSRARTHAHRAGWGQTKRRIWLSIGLSKFLLVAFQKVRRRLGTNSERRFSLPSRLCGSRVEIPGG